MENAGRGCVDVLQGLGISGPVVIATGRGNNGGDGFVIARHLSLRGYDCRVAMLAPAEKLSGDALTAYRMLQPCGVPEVILGEKPAEQLQDFAPDGDWVVDALLGTGATGDPRPPYDAAIRWMNEQPARRLAVDLPSGLDCDTGQPGEPTFRADHTCTFVARKLGFDQPTAAEFLGEVHVVSIGFPFPVAE